jgi:hypothetical protein
MMTRPQPQFADKLTVLAGEFQPDDPWLAQTLRNRAAWWRREEDLIKIAPGVSMRVPFTADYGP